MSKLLRASRGHDGLDEETATWVDWATKKADWFDPILARDDELFGQREHEKSSSDKVLKEKWYW